MSALQKDGMHFSEGGYEHISKKLFNELNAGVYYLEYDTERAGGFEVRRVVRARASPPPPELTFPFPPLALSTSLQPLADLPANKVVVLGLVTSKFPQLEKKEDLIKRINEAADFVAKGANQTREEALKRLCLSPQCGYASHAEGNPVSRENVRREFSAFRRSRRRREVEKLIQAASLTRRRSSRSSLSSSRPLRPSGVTPKRAASSSRSLDPSTFPSRTSSSSTKTTSASRSLSSSIISPHLNMSYRTVLFSRGFLVRLSLSEAAIQLGLALSLALVLLRATDVRENSESMTRVTQSE